MMKKLRYSNTNTFFLEGSNGGLLIDTDYAGTLPAFFRAIKAAGITVRDISYVMATHYHPDHMGLISELMEMDIRLLLIDTQKEHVHFSDHILMREPTLRYKPINESLATIISCEESRSFLDGIGIKGEIISTPSHSADSVSVMLDNGQCFVGDLEHEAVISGYESNEALKNDWSRVMSFQPKQVYFAHANETEYTCEAKE